MKVAMELHHVEGTEESIQVQTSDGQVQQVQVHSSSDEHQVSRGLGSHF